jgi:NtrC-family two-component system sensor histidine kinase KinB
MDTPAKKRSFRRQILLGYGVATILTAIVLAWGLVNLLRLGQASDAILRENYRSILAAEKMRGAIQQQQSATVFLLVKTDFQLARQLSGTQQQFLLNLAKAKDNITISGEAEVLEELEREYTEYMFHFTQFVGLPRTDNDEALAYYQKNLQPQVEAIEHGCDRLLELNQTTMVAGSNRAQRVAHAAVWSMLVVGCGAILIGVVFSLVLSTRVSRPVRELVDATNRVASGNYDVVVTGRSSNEFADLADHFNTMVAKLRAFHALRVSEILDEKKKTEAILQTIDDGIFVVDGERKVVSLNPAAVAALGLSFWPMGQPDVREVISDEGLTGEIEAALQSPAAATEPEHEGRYVTIQHGEHESQYEYSITPVEASAGNRIGVVVVLRDVTRLRELDRLKSEFVMTASHELRTPLTSIEMSVNLLQERAGDKLDPSEQELLGVALEEIVRLKHLVGELLDLTKIESGKIEMQVTETAPQQLLESAVEPFHAQAEQRGVALLLDVAEGLPDIQCDPNKIAWVITNLVGNALRYTGSGGHIWVSAGRAGRWVNLYVRDDGEGIPYDKQAAIFGKFVQVEESGPAGGAGLGLAISKEIVRAHRGHIWVESEPGKGSLFTITLPV